MDFKLKVVGAKPHKGDLVLEAETPLSGIRFVEVAGQTLRRSIDHVTRHRHITLGALAAYEMNVPQAIALDSGLFETSNEYVITVENNLLADFIFYGANVSNAATRKPCYPYMSNEVTLTSYIDELRFLELWVTLGYPEGIRKVDGNYVAWDDDEGKEETPMDPDCPGAGPACVGCTVLCHRHGYRPIPVQPLPPEPPWPPAPPPCPPAQDPLFRGPSGVRTAVKPPIGTLSIGEKTFATPCGDLAGHDITRNYIP